MKSLADNYKESHGSNHETIADLVFCALVVLILFIMALAFEVSQRIRKDSTASVTAAPKPAPVQEVEQLKTLSPEAIKELSVKLQKQSAEIQSLREELLSSQEQLQANRAKVDQQLAGLAGEQRFTGAREPAAVSVAFDYLANRYYFVSTKLVEHADRRQSGESQLEYLGRKRAELMALAVRTRRQRGFRREEMQALYGALSQYQEVTEQSHGYVLESSNVGLHYHTLLCQFIAEGDTSNLDVEDVVVQAIGLIRTKDGAKSDQMYPSCRCKVHSGRRSVEINGLVLSPADLRDLLLAVSGRGIVLDFEGYNGAPPKWLHDEVLMPAGYISKTPKLPQR